MVTRYVDFNFLLPTVLEVTFCFRNKPKSNTGVIISVCMCRNGDVSSSLNVCSDFFSSAPRQVLEDDFGALQAS